MKQVILNWLKSNQSDEFKAKKLEEYFNEKLNFIRFQRNEFSKQNKGLSEALGKLMRSMLVHPDCVKGSEFDDFTTMANDLINSLK